MDILDLIDPLSDPSSTERISESRPQGSPTDTRPSLHYLVRLGLGEPLQLLAEPSQLDPELVSDVPRVIGQCAGDLQRRDPVRRIQDGPFPMNKTSSPCLPLYDSLVESLRSHLLKELRDTAGVVLQGRRIDLLPRQTIHLTLDLIHLSWVGQGGQAQSTTLLQA